MATQRLGAEFKLPLKSKYDTVDCTITVNIEGNAVPNLETIGQAFEAARVTFEEHIAASYAPKPVAPEPLPAPTTAIA
jgi:hypothetical protein